MTNQRRPLSRAALERLHKTVVTDGRWPCPSCKADQETNGLIAWCKNGHVYSVHPDDVRYRPH